MQPGPLLLSSGSSSSTTAAVATQTTPELMTGGPHVSNGNRRQRPKPHDDTDFRLASSGGRIVYAKPQDLPSYPSVGLKSNGSAASAAATLGWATQTSPELWKPDKSASASAAAVLAKDYKMAPSWEPAASSHGARAALLASQAARSSTDSFKPSSPASHPHSAATLAFQADRSDRGRNINPAGSAKNEDLVRRGSLHAAKGAMASRRQRAISTPVMGPPSYPDEANAASNALAAATRAHKSPVSPSREDMGSVPYTKMDRQMFTSNPPVKTESEDRKHADVLHASAVAMAKKMYNQQQKIIEARKARGEEDPAGSDDERPVPMGFNSLQDAAYRQAQARLAKLHEDNLKNREYQEYYGATDPHRRLTVRGKLRRRATSDGDIVSEDQERSAQIRRQMSIFSSKLSQVNEKKRQEDRDALLAAAHKNVQARLKGMDEKISAETGMVPPSKFSQWELKAHATAQARSYDRVSATQPNKVDLGAGLKLDQEAIDAIAAKRVQPVLDEINEKAEKERARLTEIRLEEERKKTEQEAEKARKKELDDLNRKIKEEDRQRLKEQKAEEKEQARLKREDQRVSKVEQKRSSQFDNQATADESMPAAENDEHDPGRQSVTVNTSGQPVTIPWSDGPNEQTTWDAADQLDTDAKSPSDMSRGRRVTSWFKSRFSKGNRSPNERENKLEKRGSFVGGAALSGMDEGRRSSASVGNLSASVRAVAMAGRKQKNRQSRVSHDGGRRSGLSSDGGDMSSHLSSSSDDEFYGGEGPGRQSTSGGLSPPGPSKKGAGPKGSSPVRDSRFHEIM